MNGLQFLTIQEIAEAVNVGHVGPSTNFRSSDGVPFLMGKNVGMDGLKLEKLEKVTAEFHTTQKKSQLRPGDVVVVRIGKSGMAAVIPEDLGPANCSGLVIIKQPALVQSEYLAHFLNSPTGRSSSVAKARGSTRQTLNTRSIAATKVPVPTLEVQQQIVAAIAAKRQKGRRVANLLAQNAAAASSLLAAKLDADMRLEQSRWNRSTLGAICRFIDYRGRTPKKTPDGLPLITARNVKNGFISMDPREFVDPNSYDAWMTRGIPRAGDVLFTTEAPLGNVAQLNTDEKVVFAQRIIVLQPDRSVVDPSFLKFILMSPQVRHSIQVRATGATASGIKSSRLKEIEIPFPASLGEQCRLADGWRRLETKSSKLCASFIQQEQAVGSLEAATVDQIFHDLIGGAT